MHSASRNVAVRRDVVFATPPAHTVQCCRSSLALAVCTVAMLGAGRGRGSSRDASPAAVASGEVAAWYEADGFSDAGADVAGNARATVAAQAEPNAEVDRQRQFAIFVPMDYRNREFLEALPWQSIAVVSYKQEPFNSRVIRCREGGDTYQVFFDCTMLASPGTRPTSWAERVSSKTATCWTLWRSLAMAACTRRSSHFIVQPCSWSSAGCSQA